MPQFGGKYGTKGMFAAIGQMISSPSNIKSHVTSSGRRAAYGIAGKGASKKKATQQFQAAYQKRATQVGKRAFFGIGGLGAVTAARPNSNESRTSYRGPTQTGRGVGRYS